MAYGSVLTDVVQGSTASTPPQFNDGNGTQIGTLCRAWVNFNGTGTVAIRASFNVSSITDNGTGAYTVNFTTALPDANYSAEVSVGRNTGGGGSGLGGLVGSTNDSVAPTTSAVNVVTFNYNWSNADSPYISVSVFR